MSNAEVSNIKSKQFQCDQNMSKISRALISEKSVKFFEKKKDVIISKIHNILLAENICFKPYSLALFFLSQNVLLSGSLHTKKEGTCINWVFYDKTKNYRNTKAG